MKAVQGLKEKKSKLLLVQIDHVTGETLGFAIERIMELGAHNVQLIPTITKKNRPGSVMLIDVETAKEGPISDFLAAELKVSGYHRIDTSHVFHKITFVKKKLGITANGKKILFQCDFKLTGDPSDPSSFDVEHRALVKAQGRIKEKSGVFIPLSELRTMVISKFIRTR